MNRAIKTFMALALSAGTLAAGQPAHAASFKTAPGVSMDLWVTWPDESRWGDRDAMLPFPEWRRSVTMDRLETLKGRGIGMIRLPVDPSPFLSSSAAALRGELLDQVGGAVRELAAAGFRVILDLHSIPAGPNRSIGTAQVLESETLFDAYLAFVRDAARLVARMDPQTVALEVMNEPVSGCTSPDERKDWEEKLKRLYAAARASALDTTLILSGACWGGAEGLAALDPGIIPDDNIMWSFHSYAPFILTHQGAGWTGDVSPYATGIPFPPNGENATRTKAALDAIRARVDAEAPFARKSGIIAFVEEELAKLDTPEKLAAEMEKPFATVAEWASRHGVAPADIILGEFGMIRQEYGHDFVMKPHWRAAYVEAMASHAMRHGFAWSVWGYGGAFGVVEEFEGRPAEPDVLDALQRAATPK